MTCRKAPLCGLSCVSAVVLVDSDGRILVTQRPQGKSMEGLWEFPGGKIEQGETPEYALCRELHEELGIMTCPACLQPVAFASHSYDDFHLLMPVFACRNWKGEVTSREKSGDEMGIKTGVVHAGDAAGGYSPDPLDPSEFVMFPPAAREIIQNSIDMFWGCAAPDHARLLCLSGHDFYDHPVKPIARIQCRGTDGETEGDCLAHEDQLPFKTETMTHIVVTHMLELTACPGDMMREIARVMEPEGRLLLVVANRGGLWARRDDTILGLGQPYTLGQITGVLDAAKLRIERTRHALLVPPMHNQRWFARLSRIFEPLAPFFPFFCGVHVVEVVKKVHALPPGTKAPAEKQAAWGKPALSGLSFEPRLGNQQIKPVPLSGKKS